MGVTGEGIMVALASHTRRVVVVAALVLSAASCSRPGAKTVTSATTGSGLRQPITATAGKTVELVAKRMAMPLRDGSSAPMWGFCASDACSDAWAPGPTIIASAGDSLDIKLTNNLPVATSLVVLGQNGGGLGKPTMMPSPAHPGQSYTTFPGNAPAGDPTAGPTFVPPKQGDRVRSFGTEVPPATADAPSTTLHWDKLKPGTYIYETGTLPSLQVPMGLYGVLVVVEKAPSASGSGVIYGNVSYDADATLLFSEVDAVQNAAVDKAAQAGSDVNLRFNDPSCGDHCYPAAVNYAPTYFLINGRAFDKTAPQNAELDVPGTRASGNVLVRLANAGSRTHIPALVGLTMSLVAEDGNRLPGSFRLQNEVLLTAGKSYDVLVSPPSADGKAYDAGTFPLFDRALNLSSGNKTDGGMQAFLLVNHDAAVAAGAQAGDPGMLPIAVTPPSSTTRSRSRTTRPSTAASSPTTSPSARSRSRRTPATAPSR